MIWAEAAADVSVRLSSRLAIISAVRSIEFRISFLDFCGLAARCAVGQRRLEYRLQSGLVPSRKAQLELVLCTSSIYTLPRYDVHDRRAASDFQSRSAVV